MLAAVFVAVVTLLMAIPLIVALVGASVAWEAYVLTVLWGWFVVPQFHLEPLGFGMACGVSALHCLFESKVHSPLPKDAEKSDKVARYIAPAVRPLVALGIGWAVHRWML